ncbi:MAG: hypothetical protein M3268_03345, partial [Acidobacteriota bacterium]|nr:hypothetical protein [Acidobacteriota bacterium]
MLAERWRSVSFALGVRGKIFRSAERELPKKQAADLRGHVQSSQENLRFSTSIRGFFIMADQL